METRSLILVALCVASAGPLSEALEPLRPLEQALKSRSDAFGAYANDFTQEYEPVAYAAIPLHRPMPVIAILSDNPLAPTTPKVYGQKVYASSVKHASYTKPDYQNYLPTEYNQYTKDPDYQKYASVEYQRPFSSMEYQKPYNEYPKYTPIEYVKPEYTNTYTPIEYAKHYTPDYVKPDFLKSYPPVDYRPYPSDYVKPYASADAPTILYARPSKDGGYTYRRRPLRNQSAKRPRKEKPMIIRVHKYRVIRGRRSGY